MINSSRILIFIIIILSGCANVQYNDLYKYIKVATLGERDISVTQEDLLNRQFSLLKIRVGRGAPVFASLAYIRGDIFEWVLPNNQRILTRNGKIVKTENISHNISILDQRRIKDITNTSIVSNYLVQLSNPNAIINSESSWEFLKTERVYLSKEHDASKYREIVNYKNLRKRFKNYYWIDNVSKRVVLSYQTIHPNLPKLTLEFYY